MQCYVPVNSKGVEPVTTKIGPSFYEKKNSKVKVLLCLLYDMSPALSINTIFMPICALTYPLDELKVTMISEKRHSH